MIGRTNSVGGGSGSIANPYIASTATELEAYLVDGYAGAVVLYSGTTTSDYENGRLYVINEEATA